MQRPADVCLLQQHDWSERVGFCRAFLISVAAKEMCCRLRFKATPALSKRVLMLPGACAHKLGVWGRSVRSVLAGLPLPTPSYKRCWKGWRHRRRGSRPRCIPCRRYAHMLLCTPKSRVLLFQDPGFQNNGTIMSYCSRGGINLQRDSLLVVCNDFRLGSTSGLPFLTCRGIAASGSRVQMLCRQQHLAIDAMT